MKILVADDDPIARRLLQHLLEERGYIVNTCADGVVAWDLLQRAEAPQLIILDWVMPRMDGLEVCRKLRSVAGPCPTYILLVTSKDQHADIVAGLEAGADDYLSKPFNRDEFQARVQVGVRVVKLQQCLAERVRELETTLAQAHHLRGLLPICAYCKKIRNHENDWEQVERYISARTHVQFSHGICPDCYGTVVQDELAYIRAKQL